MLRPLLSLCFAFECFEPVVPELLEERHQLDETFRSRLVQPLGAVASLAHQPRLLEDVQVLGDGRPGDVEVRRDLTRGELRAAYSCQVPPVSTGTRAPSRVMPV